MFLCIHAQTHQNNMEPCCALGVINHHTEAHHSPNQYYTIKWCWMEGSDWFRVLFLWVAIYCVLWYDLGPSQDLHYQRLIHFLAFQAMTGEKWVAILKDMSKRKLGDGGSGEGGDTECPWKRRILENKTEDKLSTMQFRCYFITNCTLSMNYRAH